MPEPISPLRERDGGVVVALHVQPRARKTEPAGIHGASLKLRVAAPAVEDAANRAVVAFFAESLQVPRSGVRILSGTKSREKLLRIDGLTLARFLQSFPDWRLAVSPK